MSEDLVLTFELVTFESEGSTISGRLFSPGGIATAAVILCHDAFSHQVYWEETARLLVENGFSVLTFDFTGHGLSSGLRSQVEMPVWAYNLRDAMNFLGRRGFRRFGLVGHGMGGSAALIACAHDRRIQCCVVLAAPVLMIPSLADRIIFSTASLIGPVVGWLRRRPFTLSRLTDLDEEDIAVDENVCAVYREDPVVRQAYAAAPIPQSLHAAWLDITTSVKKVTQPVLVLHGQKDRIVPVKQSQTLMEKLGSPKKEVLFEDSGHALHLDQTSREVFIQIVKWVKKHLAS